MNWAGLDWVTLIVDTLPCIAVHFGSLLITLPIQMSRPNREPALNMVRDLAYSAVYDVSLSRPEQ